MSTPDTSAPERPSVRKLLVLAPNWVGDAVMALPLIRDLRGAWPAAEIIVGARRGVEPLFSMVPHVDGTLPLERHRGPGAIRSAASDVRQLAAADFDAALLLPNSFASAWLVRRARIPERWGFARDWRRPLLTRAIPPPPGYGHQVEYYQALGPALGVAAGPPYAQLAVPADAREAASALLAARGVAGRYAVFAPGAAYGRAKQWIPSHFAELARRLAEDGVPTVLVGAQSDVAACAEIATAATAVDLSGATDLRTLAALLEGATAVVANDSGAMHLAAAVGAPLTAIFGPTNEQKTSPLRAHAAAPLPTIVTSDVWCRPCMLRECPIDHRCMTRISAARVYEMTRARHER